MYAMVRWDRVDDPIRLDEVTQRLSEGLVPIFRAMMGYLACYVVVTETGDVICTVLFIDAEAAAASAERAAGWISWHVGELLAGPAETAVGHVAGT